jgi:hypothetical protein
MLASLPTVAALEHRGVRALSLVAVAVAVETNRTQAPVAVSLLNQPTEPQLVMEMTVDVLQLVQHRPVVVEAVQVQQVQVSLHLVYQVLVVMAQMQYRVGSLLSDLE